MKSQTYESVIIVNAALDDSQIESVADRVKNTITTNGGNILDFEKWGRKRLAYPIQKSKNGYYIIFRFTAPTEAITKIERMYRLDETIVRYLTTVMELKDIANFEKVKRERTLSVEVETKNEDKVTTETKEAVVITKPEETAVTKETADVETEAKEADVNVNEDK